MVNVSLGAQYRLSPKTAFQAGFFTDFSGQPDALIDELHPEKPQASTTEPNEPAPAVPEVAPPEPHATEAKPGPPPQQDRSAKSPHAKKKVNKTRKKDSE